MGSKTSKATELRVPDAENLATFLKQAKEVYNKAHPQATKKKGRPVVQGLVYQALATILGDTTLKKSGGSSTGEPSQGYLVKLVKKDPNCSHLSDDTIKKYVKTYLLLWKDPSQLKPQEIRWLAKYNPKALAKMIVGDELITSLVNDEPLPEWGMKLLSLTTVAKETMPNFFANPYPEGSPNNPPRKPLADKKQVALAQRDQLKKLFQTAFNIQSKPSK